MLVRMYINIFASFIIIFIIIIIVMIIIIIIIIIIIYFILLFFLDSAYQNSVRQLEDARLLWEKEMEQCCEVRFFDVFAH